MNVPVLNEKSWDEIMGNQKSVAVLFGADWCGPYRQMRKEFDQIENSSIVPFYWLDTDNNGIFPSTLKVTSIPTLVLYQNGQEVQRVVGAVSFDSALEKLKIATKVKIKVERKEQPMKTEKNMLAVATFIAAREFLNKEDRGGRAYIKHCEAVASGVAIFGEIYEIVGMLHDVPEDTKITFKDLYAEGFCSKVINALDCLTHRPGEGYDDYIIRAGSNDIAREVKKSDLRHNMQPERLKGLREKDFERTKKYQKAYAYLEGL